jgi:hypothetical protein
VVVTAGHCIELGGGSADDWLHNGAKIGDALLETWAVGADADVGLVTVLTSGSMWPATKNEVLAGPGTWVGKINAVRSNTQQHEGDALCRVGITSGRTCGTLTLYDETNDSCNPAGTDCRAIDHTNETSFDSLGGDSGGSVFQYSPTPGYVIGYGTHVHSGTPAQSTSWYSPIGWGYTAYDFYHPYTYHVCVTSAC